MATHTPVTDLLKLNLLMLDEIYRITGEIISQK